MSNHGGDFSPLLVCSTRRLQEGKELFKKKNWIKEGPGRIGKPTVASPITFQVQYHSDACPPRGIVVRDHFTLLESTPDI